MKKALLLILGMCSVLPFFGCGGNVKYLSLRDERLPLEARRWLADAEDEVAIARARVVDAENQSAKIEDYRQNMVKELKEQWGGARGGAAGLKAWQMFAAYTDERVTLAELTLRAAQVAEDLARMRLTQARAETAMRYDLAVYELPPIAERVEKLRDEVAAMTKVVEAQRVKVEKSAGEAWKMFYQFARKNGVTNALWYTY